MKFSKCIACILWLVMLFPLRAQISQSERHALIDLFIATDGFNWTQNTNWDTNTTSTSDVSTWHGVNTKVIDGTERVVQLFLENNNLN